jgi:multicomponent K+:H+ antiporter subunit A
VVITALSMAGIPPLNGFLSKEMMLEEAAHTVWAGIPWLFPLLATLGALFSVAYSFRYISHGFLGPVRNDYPHKPHDPGFGLWASPALLAVLVVVIGVLPMTAAAWLVDVAVLAVTQAPGHIHIAHWHGIDSPALWMSVIAVAGALVLMALHPRLAALWEATAKPDAKAIFDTVIEALAAAASWITETLHDGVLRRSFAIATLSILAAGIYAFATGQNLPGTRALLTITPIPAFGWLALALATFAILIYHHNRVLTLILVGVIGLMISISFAYFSAPDLALTQISVEVVTVILMILALNFLPKHSPRESSPSRRMLDLGLSAAAGLGIAGLSYALMTRDFAFPTIADFHIANAKSGGGGTNIVNVILVDFRGYDTFGEITVLGIAAILIYALTEALLRTGPANDRLLAWQPSEARSGDRHPMILVVATRLILPVAMMVGVFIFLRGHNQPGGGFVAGLVMSIALLMQYMASGFAWTVARQKVDYHGLIASGVLIAAATGIGSWLAGKPFLTSAYGYVHAPPLEEFELATAAIFDLGVFLTVLGAVMLSLASLSRIAQRAGETVNEQPFELGPQTPAGLQEEAH